MVKLLLFTAQHKSNGAIAFRSQTHSAEVTGSLVWKNIRVRVELQRKETLVGNHGTRCQTPVQQPVSPFSCRFAPYMARDLGSGTRRPDAAEPPPDGRSLTDPAAPTAPPLLLSDGYYDLVMRWQLFWQLTRMNWRQLRRTM